MNPDKRHEALRQVIPEELADLTKPDITEETPRKVCPNCDKEFPLTEDYWHRDSSTPDGWRQCCSACRLMSIRNQSGERTSKKIDEFNEKISGLISDVAMQAPITPGRAENLGKLYETTMHAFGGAHVIGSLIAGTFATANPHIRFKILQMILSMSKQVTEMGLAEKNLEDKTEAELIEEFERLARSAGMTEVAQAALKRVQSQKEMAKELGNIEEEKMKLLEGRNG